MDALEGRVLKFNTSVATVWGRQEAVFKRKGCPMPMPASFNAATPRRHNLTLVTRNVADYTRPGLKMFNPTLEKSSAIRVRRSPWSPCPRRK